jgi:hypothetical protein
MGKSLIAGQFSDELEEERDVLFDRFPDPEIVDLS